MKLRIAMLIATIVAAGTGLVFAEKYIVTWPKVDFADLVSSRESTGEKDDSEVSGHNQELIVLGRMSMKDIVARKLINGELTLEQAAARFVELNRDNKWYYVGLDCNYPRVDLNEAVYRHVVKWTETLYEGDADYPEICARLEKAFEECREEKFPLPFVPLRRQATAE
jgi:hypothetical protein